MSSSKKTSASSLTAGIPLEPRIAGCPIPLTAFQRRIATFLFGAGRLSSRSCVIAVRLSGALDAGLLRSALDTVVRRHESLRTRFIMAGDTLEQRIDAAGDCNLDVIELGKESPQFVAAQALRLAAQFVEQKVDISVGPLFAAKLLKLSDLESVLILAAEHMITDGVSNQILNRELWTLYYQGLRGLPFSLPALPVQFADYAIWQQRTYGMWQQKHEGYWKNRLTGAQRIRLPCRNDPPKAEPVIAQTMLVSFGAELSQRLRESARRERTLLALIVLTVYVAVMSRWCQQEDFVLVFYSNGRHRPELENMIGLIANFPYMRVQLTSADTFLDVFRRVHLEFCCVLEHQDFDRVPDLIPDCTTLTELFFSWAPTQWAQWTTEHREERSHGVEVQPLMLQKPVPHKFAPYFFETGTGINVSVVYRPDLFTADTIERFADNLRSFAAEFSERPLTRLASISMR